MLGAQNGKNACCITKKKKKKQKQKTKNIENKNYLYTMRTKISKKILEKTVTFVVHAQI